MLNVSYAVDAISVIAMAVKAVTLSGNSKEPIKSFSVATPTC